MNQQGGKNGCVFKHESKAKPFGLSGYFFVAIKMEENSSQFSS